MIKIDEKKYMSLKEYANYRDVSIQTVYNWIKWKHVVTRKLMDKTLIEI